MNYIKLNSYTIPQINLTAAVIGSGAAGLACAGYLYKSGVKNIALITEGINMGTSRNTGSDKQTYYKLSLTGNRGDSITDLAKSFCECGAMHGDLALTEAAGSSRAFFNLVGLGVPFPTNEYGEYAAYRTDHDGGRGRATSCGPLTSRIMTERLEADLRQNNINIFDGCRVVEILSGKSSENKKAVTGVIAICSDYITADNPFGLICFSAQSVVWATGGPASIYSASVYPESQTGSHGVAFLAGAEGCNLTEWQYGIASMGPRWNLSGSYQQVIPRYFSIDTEGNEHEFLNEAFITKPDLFGAIFKKGYEWPFDPHKCGGIEISGILSENIMMPVCKGSFSSCVDLAVYVEKMRGRRVFMDFTRNPQSFSVDLLPPYAHQYLLKSDVLNKSSPFERLYGMNRCAVDFFKSHNIDLKTQPIEIDVCAQHNNGGFSVDIWYESTSLPGLFIIGEAAGVFGVTRPGGSALNSTQVGALRAAQRIAKRNMPKVQPLPEISRAADLLDRVKSEGSQGMSASEIANLRKSGGALMSRCGAFIRDKHTVAGAIVISRKELLNCTKEIKLLSDDFDAIREFFVYYDSLITRYVYLRAIEEYLSKNGTSRGSYIISGKPAGSDPLRNKICKVKLECPDGGLAFEWEHIRPIPDSEQWFEKIYNSQY